MLRQFDQYQDNGYWLIFIVLPIALIAFRRGWLLQLLLPLMAISFVIQPQPVMANDWDKLWSTADQQGQQALQDGDASKAAALFEDSQWKGVAHYQNGDYAAAEASFNQPKTSNEFYNYGNALAQQQKLDQAAEAYKQALTLNPDNQLAAQAKAIIEQAQEQQEQGEGEKGNEDNQQSSDQQQNSDQQDQDSGESQGGESSGDGQQQDSSSENSSEDGKPSDNNQSLDGDDSHLQQGQQPTPEQQQSPQDKPRAAQSADEAGSQEEPLATTDAGDDTPPTDATEEQATASDATSQQTPPQDAATQQWLRQIPDEPSGLLRRKFEYQYQQNRRLQPADDELRW